MQTQQQWLFEMPIPGDTLRPQLSLSSPVCRKQLASTKVAVVGAGFAGLMAAKWLRQHGIQVTVFEARPQVGGRVLSNTTFSRGRITEEGAELIGSFHTTWLALAREYGLSLISRMDPKLYEQAGLNLKLTLHKPLTMQEFFDLEEAMRKRVLEPMAWNARQIDDKYQSQPWRDARLQKMDNTSVADALQRTYSISPNEPLWKMIEFRLVNDEVAPLNQMNYLGLLCKVKGGQGIPRFRYEDKKDKTTRMMRYWDELEIFRCADGCQTLAKKMAEQIQSTDRVKQLPPAKLLLSRAVTHINLTKQDVILWSKRVVSSDGKLAEEASIPSTYSYVILAIPPSVWGDMKIKAEGKNAHPNDEIGKIGMAPAVKFFSDVKQRFWIKNSAAPYGGSLKIGQVWEGTDNQTRVGQQGIVLSVFAGPILSGPHGPRVPTPKEFVLGLRDLYNDYTSNLTKRPLFSDWPNVPFIKTGYVSPRLGEIFTIVKQLNEPFHDRLFFAGEHTQMDFFGYMEGALRSGIRAANQLMFQSCGVPMEAAPMSSNPSVRVASSAPIRNRAAF